MGNHTQIITVLRGYFLQLTPTLCHFPKSHAQNVMRAPKDVKWPLSTHRGPQTLMEVSKFSTWLGFKSSLWREIAKLAKLSWFWVRSGEITWKKCLRFGGALFNNDLTILTTSYFKKINFFLWSARCNVSSPENLHQNQKWLIICIIYICVHGCLFFNWMLA